MVAGVGDSAAWRREETVDLLLALLGLELLLLLFGTMEEEGSVDDDVEFDESRKEV